MSTSNVYSHFWGCLSAILTVSSAWGADLSSPAAEAAKVTSSPSQSPQEAAKSEGPAVSKVSSDPQKKAAEQKKDRPSEILDFWFGTLEGPDTFPAEKAKRWFAHSPENQVLMNNMFGADLRLASTGEYNSWRETPRGRLALILLLDQIPRNIYGEKPLAYAFDRMAQGLAIEGINNGDDARLLPMEKIFFYLPLVHTEDSHLQDLSVAKYEDLVNRATVKNKPYLQEMLRYAMIHRNIIKKFGRFPSRNAAYGRPSTPEESAYLMQWGSYPN